MTLGVCLFQILKKKIDFMLKKSRDFFFVEILKKIWSYFCLPTTLKNPFKKKVNFNLYICYLLVEKNRFWEKLILIAFHFRIKIDYFFDKMIFRKILNKHLKIKKVIFFKGKNRYFLKKDLKQTDPRWLAYMIKIYKWQ